MRKRTLARGVALFALLFPWLTAAALVAALLATSGCAALGPEDRASAERVVTDVGKHAVDRALGKCPEHGEECGEDCPAREDGSDDGQDE